VLRVESDDGEVGESASPAPTRSIAGVPRRGMADAQRATSAPALLGAPGLTATDVQPLLHEFKGHRMAKAALEMAVLDAELRAAGVSFAAYLGGVADVGDARHRLGNHELG